MIGDKICQSVLSIIGLSFSLAIKIRHGESRFDASPEYQIWWTLVHQISTESHPVLYTMWVIPDITLIFGESDIMSYQSSSLSQRENKYSNILLPKRSEANLVSIKNSFLTIINDLVHCALADQMRNKIQMVPSFISPQLVSHFEHITTNLFFCFFVALNARILIIFLVIQNGSDHNSSFCTSRYRGHRSCPSPPRRYWAKPRVVRYPSFLRSKILIFVSFSHKRHVDSEGREMEEEDLEPCVVKTS